MWIAPAVATVFRSICPPTTVRLTSAVVAPTAARSSTDPVCASRVRAWAPFTVEVKVMEPSVASSSSSLFTVTAPASVTGPVKVMAPSSLR